MSQLSFVWPASVSLAAEDYFISDANRAAHDMLRDPARWPLGKLALIGPEASGKSHLARLFASTHGAQILDAPALTGNAPMPEGALVLEDMDRLPGAAQEWVFHAHNALAGRAPLLLTARSAPARWPLSLPDLASRMQAATPIAIGPPDDALLTAVLMKHFADRQIAPDPTLPAYLASRIERSFAALAEAVAALDRLSLELQRPINKRLASDWLAGRF